MKEVLKKSNQLISTKISVESVNQQRLIYTSMALVNSDVPELVGLSDDEITYYYRKNFEKLEFRFCFSDFCSLWGINHKEVHRSIQSEVDKATLHMTDLKLSALTDKGAKHINAVEEAGFDTELSEVWVRFTASFMPYMINLHKRMMGYTTIPIQYMSDFRSRYSFKLLEMLLQEASKGKNDLEIKVSDLRVIFDCENKYSDYRDFRKRTVDVAIDDISDIAIDDVKVKIEEIRARSKGKGKKPVDSIRFIFDFPNYIKAKKQLIEKSRQIKDGKSDDGHSKSNGSGSGQPQTVPSQGLSKRAQEMADEVARLKAEGLIP